MKDIDVLKNGVNSNGFPEPLQILDRITDGFVAVDRELRFTYINRAGASMAGRLPEQIIGKVIWEIYPEALGTTFEIEYRRALRENVAVHFEEYLTSVKLWLEVNAYPSETGLSIFFRNITERKRNAERLRESEERYRTLFNSIDEGFCVCEMILDENGKPFDYRFLEANPMFEVHTGLKNALGKTAREMVPNLEERWFEIYGKVALTGEPIRFIDRSEPMNRWFDVFAFRIGQPEQRKFALLFNDITERKKAEDALRESENQLRLVSDALPALIAYVDSEQRYRFVNKGYTEWFKIEREEIIGRHVSEIIGEAAYKIVLPLIEKVLSGERPVFEQLFSFPDGEKFVHVNYIPQLDSTSGQIKGFYSLVQDITEPKRSAAALHESEARFRYTFEQAPVGVLQINPDGTLKDVNPAYCRMTGYEARELIGRKPTDWTHPEDARYDEEFRQFFVENPIQQRSREKRYICKDGKIIWIDLTVTGVRDDNNNLFGIGIVQDITERKHAEQALREADRKKDEFIATLAHELRNPLAPVRTALEIMRGGTSREKELEARQIMERQVGQLIHLVDDLLDISRITLGKIQLKKEILDLRDAINAALEASLPLMTNLQQELTISIPNEPIFVEGDSIRLAQIFLNLLNNAAKFTEAGGKISLSATLENEKAIVRISDTGLGIPPDMLERIFEMFAQVERNGTRSQTGLGIGLNLVKRLTEKHNGEVTAFSDGANTGSEFTVRLPLAKESETAQNPESETAQSAPPDLRRLKILVVDDNVDAADMMQFALEMENHQVLTAYNGESAVISAIEFQPDACLLDIGLPDIDGYEVASRLRAEFPETLLIAVSGWGQEEDRRRSFLAGFNHHLVKPVKIEEVKNLIMKMQK